MATNFMELMMQNPDGMQVINDQGILSVAMLTLQRGWFGI